MREWIEIRYISNIRRIAAVSLFMREWIEIQSN